MRDMDCRHFRGDKPCGPSRGALCPLLAEIPGQCPSFEPLGLKVLIIKLGALGDVLRTTTLLPALTRRFHPCSVAWITKPAAVPLLEGAGLWKLLPWNLDTILWAQAIAWDMVISLDKEEGPTALAGTLRAAKKFGFGRNAHGLLSSLSPSGDDLFRLGVDDERKFRHNHQTYPRLIAEACDLAWEPNPYVLQVTEADRAWAAGLFPANDPRPRIGINVGAGEAFAGKKWPLERQIELARLLEGAGMLPVFLGGELEADLYGGLRAQGVGGFFPGCRFTLRQFSALVGQLQVLVSGDSLAMHIAIAQGIFAVTLFGSTTEREIEYYGHGRALVGKVPCAPCYRRVCPTQEECQSSIGVEEVFQAVQAGVSTGMARQGTRV